MQASIQSGLLLASSEGNLQQIQELVSKHGRGEFQHVVLPSPLVLQGSNLAHHLVYAITYLYTDLQSAFWSAMERT